MMRGLRPLFAVAALVAGSASAQEMIEIPKPPPPLPPPDCCVVVEEPPPRPPASLLFDVVAGPTYRRAFHDDFIGAFIELEAGAQNDSFGMGARLALTAGTTRYGLASQVVTIGPAANFRLSPRLRLAIGADFGVLTYERATIPGDHVWGLMAGVNGGMTVDLVRTRRGGALFLLARVGYDYVETAGGSTSGSTVTVTAALGYRY